MSQLPPSSLPTALAGALGAINANKAVTKKAAAEVYSPPAPEVPAVPPVRPITKTTSP
ncbi:MAG TPA: hypothetical protein VHT26_07645 [Trebonia sp.]|nr:hypothetical protein [Trebonia sp.]